MPAPKRRRCFSLSLRTLLIGMTLISGLFGWFLHYRMGKIAERDSYHSIHSSQIMI